MLSLSSLFTQFLRNPWWIDINIARRRMDEIARG
jgi:hypothetical protein